MSSALRRSDTKSRLADSSFLRPELSLAQRHKELIAALDDQKKSVEDSCDILRNTSKALSNVRTKYEPAKDVASTLSGTSERVTRCQDDLGKVIDASKAHEKLDRVCQNQGVDNKLQEIIDALEEVVATNSFLVKYQHMAVAKQALTKNKDSTKKAAKVCATLFENLLRTHGSTPGIGSIEQVLAQPPANRPKAEDFFFHGKNREVKLMTDIMSVMHRIDEPACLEIFVASRQRSVATMIATVTANVTTVASAAHTERKVYEWASQMRILAQLLEWEDRLARNMVPERHLQASLDAILSNPVHSTVSLGHSLANGRVQRDHAFPLLDMIVCMHDPYVLLNMKKAFRPRTMSHLKEQFHTLLSKLCEACQHCVESFSASMANEALFLRDPTQLTTVSEQTAFAMRLLKSLFRKDVKGKLTFIPDARVFATDTIKTLLSTLEGKVTAMLRDPGAVPITMLNNSYFVVARVTEHEELAEILGSSWKREHEIAVSNWKYAYMKSTWQPVLAEVAALMELARGEAKKDTVKELCKRLYTRLEKTVTVQSLWVIPDTTLRGLVHQRIIEVVKPKFVEFWHTFEHLDLFKTPQKHFKYSPDELESMVTTCLFSAAPVRAGVLKK